MNQTLDPEETLSHHGAGFLLKAITDRNQLKEIDYRLAKFIAERLSKTKGPKAFRTIPYQKIRDDWKLKSLYHTRNR